MAEGFLGRWSQRKDAVRKGKEIAPEPEVLPAPQRPSPQPSPRGGEGARQETPLRLAGELNQELPLPLAGEGRGEGDPGKEAPPPTLEEAQLLTRDSDFKRFIQPDVPPEVKNTALKKLFSDPHFNTMDGLDVYIDDYNKPDPLPESMLRQMVSAKFLGLFDDEEKEKDSAERQSPSDNAGPDAAAPQSVAQSGSRTEQAFPPADHHADPDLRLQQDDAPGPEGPGAGSR
jgi:hypothetical protein